jgi:hypothetical protein
MQEIMEEHGSLLSLSVITSLLKYSEIGFKCVCVKEREREAQI